jgi:hypothetical protein
MTIHSERVDAVIPALPTKDSTGGSKPMLSAREQVPVILLELTDRTGVWEVMQNGAICGRYLSHERACEAVEAMAHNIISKGGRVDIMLRSPR